MTSSMEKTSVYLRGHPWIAMTMAVSVILLFFVAPWWVPVAAVGLGVGSGVVIGTLSRLSNQRR
jgi:hypothetical protein